ncbi:porin family protein [Runella sp.]|uniref:porin family protein n=1 Tax=Runella sp. TaxID=1960881 RepID=UPI00301B0380
MKNTIIKYGAIFTLLLVWSFNMAAQRAEIGLRLMPTYSNLAVKTSSGGSVKGEAVLGFGVGALLGFNFTNQVGIQGEVIYNTISQKYKELDIERKIKLTYVNIPVLFSLNTGKTNVINLNIVAGPQIGISVGSKITTTGGDVAQPNAVLSVKKGDLGFAYGVGLDFSLSPSHHSRLSIGYRGVTGLFDISDNSRTITTDSYYLLDRTHIKTNAVYIGLSQLF